MQAAAACVLAKLQCVQAPRQLEVLAQELPGQFHCLRGEPGPMSTSCNTQAVITSCAVPAFPLWPPKALYCQQHPVATACRVLKVPKLLCRPSQSRAWPSRLRWWLMEASARRHTSLTVTPPHLISSQSATNVTLDIPKICCWPTGHLVIMMWQLPLQCACCWSIAGEERE